LRNWIAVNNPMPKKKWTRGLVSRFHVTASSQPTSGAKGSAADQSSAPAPLAISVLQGGVLRPLEESVFMRQGDYWTIRYQGQAAILKATRGLDCLGYLLRHPMRDVHVSELLATPIDLPTPALRGSLWEAGGRRITSQMSRRISRACNNGRQRRRTQRHRKQTNNPNRTTSHAF
jgi:hypothetical protein